MFTIKTSLSICPHSGHISFLPFFCHLPACVLLTLFLFLSLTTIQYYTTVIVIFLCLGLDLFLSFFLLSYLQFYPSRKALVIKTHAFTIIINLNSFFTNTNINWQQRDKVTPWAITFFLLFLFFSCLFSWLRWLQSSFFFIFRSSSFSFLPTFLFSSLGVELFFFFFPFFFSGGLVSTVVFLLFSFLFLLRVPHFVFHVFGFFFLVSFFWGLCVFSLFFHRLNKPLEIDS